MRIAIVEDNQLLLDNLRMLLQGEPGFTVSAVWTNAEEALASLAWTGTDVLVADLDLPGISGVELIDQVTAKCPDIESMAFTVSEDRATVFAALRAGASGYLLKSSTPRELIEALKNLYEGGAPMSPKIARKVIHHFRNPTSATPESAEEGLSRREQHVLREVERGLSYKEIGIELGISAQTVHVHIKHIYEKLHSHTRSEAMRKARQSGWI